MKTHGKFSLFILWVLVCGCPKQPLTPEPASEVIEAEDLPPKAELEADCYDGDQAACDELGH